MEINESKRKALQCIDEGIQVSQQGLRLAAQNLNTLNMGDDPDAEQEEGGGGEVDPTRFMTKQEAAEWNRLSPQSQEQFLKEGEREAECSLKRKGRGRAAGEKFSTYYREVSEQDQAAKSTYANERERHKGQSSTENKTEGSEKTNGYNVQGSGQAAEQSKNTNHVLTVENGIEGTKGGTQAVGVIEKTGTATSAAAKSSGAATSGGVTLAIEVAKKTASAFQEALESRAMATTQNVQKAQQQFNKTKEANKEMGTLPATVNYAGATIAAAGAAVIKVLIQVATSILAGLLSVLSTVIITVLVAALIICVVVALIIAISSIKPDSSGAQQIVEVALAEEGTTDGTKYWTFTQGSHFVDGSATPWCACFVSWCANECGLLDDNIFPKSASVATYREFFRAKEQLHEENSYIPQTGDLILFGSNDHIGIVQYTEGGRVITIEGNTSDAVHSRSYDLGSSYITGYCTPDYPAGEEITIPDGMGIYHTYMGWRTITSPSSLQYQLREESGENYDSEGFAKIGDRYVIACTTTFGGVGDYVDFHREDGTIIKTVIGDIKNQNDPGCNQYGHANGECVVEYVVQKSMWYPSHSNPGTAGCHPEWNSRIVKAVKLGKNYFD